MDSRELKDLSSDELYEILETPNLSNRMAQDVLMEIRRRTVNLQTLQETRYESDFFWEMQADIARQFIDEYLETAPVSAPAKRAIRERAITLLLREALIIYQEGEDVLGESGLIPIIESIMEDYPRRD